MENLERTQDRNKVTKKLTCIVCPRGCKLKLMSSGDGEIAVSGNMCPKGAKFARDEVTNPVRCLTSTVKTNSKSLPFLPVKTDGEIPKAFIRDAMKEIMDYRLSKEVSCGDVIIKNIAGSSVDLIATSDLFY